MSKFFLAGLFIVFFALRLGAIVTAVERVSYGDELDGGTIAKELNEGLKMPLMDYQVDLYSGESLLVGVAASLFFKVLGPTLFSLKLTMLSFSTLTLVLLLFFTNRHFGRSAAVLSGLLYVLCPATFVQLSLAATTGHTKSLLFSMLALIFFYEFLYLKRHESLSLGLFGVASGAGFWVYHESGIVVLTCLAAWGLTEPRSFFSRKLLHFLGAFTAGLLPWWIYNFTHDFKGAGFLFHAFFPLLPGLKSPSFIEKASDLVRTLPLSFDLDFNTEWDEAISAAYFICFLSAGGWFAVRETARFFRQTQACPRLLPLVLYPWFFIGAYLAANFHLEPAINFSYLRYLAPLHFFGFILCALALEKSPWRNLWLALFLMTGILSQSQLFFKEPFGQAFQYKGYSYFSLGMRKFQLPGAPKDYDQALSVALRFSPVDRRFFYAGLMADPAFHNLDLGKRLSRLTPELRPYLLKNAGRNLARRDGGDVEEAEAMTSDLTLQEKRLFYKSYFLTMEPRQFLDMFERLRGTDFRPRRALLMALGARLAYPDTAAEFLKVVNGLDPESKTWAYRGFGHQIMQDLAFFDPRRIEEVLRSIPFVVSEGQKQDIFWGIGWSLRKATREDPIRARDRVLKLPETYRLSAWRGFTAYEVWISLN